MCNSSSEQDALPRPHIVMHNAVMERTTVMAEPETLERLRSLARDRGTSLAQVVREALDEKAREYRPKPTFVGIASSGGSDVARNEATERVRPRSWR